MKYRITTLTAIIIIFACSFTMVYAFESELWPGEGIPVFAAKKDLTVYENPTEKSLLIKGTNIPKGEIIEFGHTRFRTIKPGTIGVLKADSTKVFTYGKINFLSFDDYYHKWKEKIINFKSGESFEVLQYRAEGQYLMRINGEVISLNPNKNMKISSESLTEWWVQALDKQKKPIGWVLIDETTVEFLNREFK